EEALKPLAGGGTVTVVRPRAWDTRFHCEVEIRSVLENGRTFEFILGFECDTATGVIRPGIQVGDFRRELDPDRPLILWRSPLDEKEITVGCEPLRKAIAAFAHLPPDHRTGEEYAHRQRQVEETS